MSTPSVRGSQSGPRPPADRDAPTLSVPTVFGPTDVDPAALPALSAHQLEVGLGAAGTSVTVAVRGEMLQETVEHFVAAVAGAADDPAVERLVVDLTRISFMDSTGLGALVSLRNQVHGRGGRFGVVRPDDRVFRLFEITHLDTVFDFVDP